MNAFAQFLDEGLGVVLTWEFVYGSRSHFFELRDALRAMHPYTLLMHACHWNALVSLEGALDPTTHSEILGLCQSSSQADDIRRALATYPAPSARPPCAVLHKHQLLLLVRLLLEEASWDDSATAGGTVDGPPLFDLLLKLNDHLYEPPPPEKAGRAKYDAFASMFALNDIYHRRSPAAAIARTREMLDEIDPVLRRAAGGSPPDIHRLFEDASRLTIKQFHNITFAAYTIAQPHSVQERTIAADQPDLTAFTAQTLQGDSAASPEEIQAYLEATSLRPCEFQTRLRQKTEDPTHFNFSIFRDYPIVQVVDGVYRTTDPDFLLNKLGDGIFWYLHRGATGRNQVNELRGWWGQLFEEYVHRLMEHFFPPGTRRYHRRPAFKGETHEAADALLALSRSAVILEYKASLIKKDVRHSGNPRRLALDVREKFAAKRDGRDRATGVTQLARTIMRLTDPASQGSRRLGPIRPDDTHRIYPVLVCFDSAMGAPLMNGFLHREFLRALKALGATDTTRIRPLTLMTIEDLENLAPYVDDYDFSAILDRCHALDPEMRTNFRTTMHQAIYSHDERSNDWLREKWHKWAQGLYRHFYPQRDVATPE